MAYAKKTTPNNEPKAKKVSDKNSPYKKEEQAYDAKMQAGIANHLQAGSSIVQFDTSNFDSVKEEKKPFIIEQAIALDKSIYEAEEYAILLKQKLHSLHDTSEDIIEDTSPEISKVTGDVVSRIQNFHQRIVRVNNSVSASLKKLNELI